MSATALADLAYDSLYPFYEFLAGAAPTSRLIELDGVTASLVPSTPQRAFPNSALYEDASRLEAALPELAAAYEDAGVKAWTVWVRLGDADARGVLERAGHRLDAQPAAMAMDLTAWEAPEGRGSGTGPVAVADVARINDAAYGWSDEFTRAFKTAPAELRLYGTQLDGKPVACAAWMRAGNDCAVYMVASLPEARGRGLATDLMIAMLTDAQAEGCSTTSLQSSAAGHAIYQRLGYQDFGALEMWERRAG